MSDPKDKKPKPSRSPVERPVYEVAEKPPAERICQSQSTLALMCGVHRQTIKAWLEQNLPWHDKRETKRGTDYSFDLAAVMDWRYQRGLVEGREAALKEGRKPSASAVPPPGSPDGSWVHPESGVVYTERDAIIAAQRKLIAEAGKAESAEAREKIRMLEDRKLVSRNEDIEAVFAFHVMMLRAALESLSDDLRKILIEADVHPDEARRRVSKPIEDMVEALIEADAFRDPTEEYATHEERRDGPDEKAGDEPDPDAVGAGEPEGGGGDASAPADPA
ncbi:MAG: hypothetical protein JWO56_2610 [Acidobacteria bacterium]|nr:hypothetical protein [Acidobacteriota bacterium]